MTKDYTVFNKVIFAFGAFMLAFFVGRLSYGWSINQTEILTAGAFGSDYADEAAWMIQIAPQVLFVAASFSFSQRQNRLGKGMIIAAIVVSALDAFTNVIGYQTIWPDEKAIMVVNESPRLLIDASYAVGMIGSVLITLGEEVMLLSIGTGIILIVEIGEAIGRPAPVIFRYLGQTMQNAGGKQVIGVQSNNKPSRNNRNQNNVTYSNISDENKNNQYQRPARVRGE